MIETSVAWTGAAVRLAAGRTSLDALDVDVATVPKAGPCEVVVRVDAAAVNRSDVLNALGVFPGVAAGRVPGRDFAGTVVDGPAGLVGTEVYGTGGGELGLTRDGSHARHLLLPAGAVVARPSILGAHEAGAAGLAYTTAAMALAEAGPITAGTTVLVLGAGGGVGGALTGLAKARGAHVVGVVRGAANSAAATGQGVDVVVDVDTEDLADSARSATSGEGVDVVIDCVGPPLVHETLPLLVTGGRLCLLTAPQGGTIQLDVLDFYRRALRVVGLNTLRHDAVATARVLREVTPAVENGDLRPPRVARTFSLAQARTAYASVLAGETGGRVVLVPAPEGR